MALYLPDANVLIHALRKGSKEHDDCRRWLTDAAAAGDALGLSELVEAALLGIPSLPRLALVPMADTLGFFGEGVGAARFELTTSCSQSKRSTKLSYAP